MARKRRPKHKPKPPKLKQETEVSFKFPMLHPDILKAVEGHILPPEFNMEDAGFDKKYPTHVMGRFACGNEDCPKKAWFSMKVAIVIRRYPGNRYNAVVFNQRCDSCKRLGTLTLDNDSYVERVAYRLKKWAGVWMAVPEYRGRTGPPHMCALCEGCKRGVCQQGKFPWSDD